MRNILVPLLIIVAAAVFLSANLFVITDGAARLEAILSEAEEAVKNGDYQKASDALTDFEKELSALRKYLDAVVSHSETDNIMLSAERLPSLCSEETAREFFAEIAVAHALIRHVRDGELPTLENIL